jgi:hypothetical protein
MVMGYYTNHNLTLHAATDEQRSKIVEMLRAKDVIGWVLDENLDNYQEAKWYEDEDDMRAISKEFPDVLFELHGEGEDSGDIWDKYFKNGKMQYCPAEIIIPPYDELKLK